MDIVLGVMPSPYLDPAKAQESILASEAPEALPKCTFYIDDIFTGLKDFEEGYALLEDKSCFLASRGRS